MMMNHPKTLHQTLFQVDGTTYEGHYIKPANYGRVEPKFWQHKAYCDGLGGGFQMPTPTNAHQNQVAHEVALVAGSTYIGIAQQKEDNGEILDDWLVD